MMGETRLVSDWIALTYPGRHWQLQFRVGHDPDFGGLGIVGEEERRQARNFNRRVDAVIEPPPELVVIEAKMWDATSAIGRLKEYLLLLPATPDVKEWGPVKVVPVLLTGQDDPVARVLCAREGIEYVFWEPPWIGEWYAAYVDRRRKAPHSGLTDELVKQYDVAEAARRAGLASTSG